MKTSAVKYVKAVVNLLLLLLTSVLVIWLAPKVIVFFMPFVIGWVIAWIAAPMVKFFEEKLKIKRKTGSAFVIIVVIGVVVLGLYLICLNLIRQMIGFIQDFPSMWEGLQQDFLEIANNLSGILGMFPESIQNAALYIGESANDIVMNLVNRFSEPAIDWVSEAAKQIPTIIIAVVMCLLAAYFFVAERNSWFEPVRKRIPKSIYSRMALVSNSVRVAVGGYIKAQFKIEIWIYLLLVIGLMILDVNYAPLVALGIAFLDIIPFLGTGTAMVPWAVIKFLSGDYKMTIGLLIIWGVSQLVRQFIQPKIMGDSMGMPPVPTLFFLYIGYKVGSVIGMILALPIAIILVTMYKEGVFDTTKKSVQILTTGLNRFRKITDEDMQEVKQYKEQEESENEKL